MRKRIVGCLVLLLAGAASLPAQEMAGLPAEIVAKMTKGNPLGMVWTSPKFDPAQGFTVGPVSSLAEGSYADVVQYFPEALNRIAIRNSPNVLYLTVTELAVVTRSGAGYETATIGVEGKVVGKDGAIVMAFTTREEIADRDSARGDCKGAMDKIVWSLAKNLGKPYMHALEVQQAMGATGVQQSGNTYTYTPPKPPAPEPPLSLNDRMLRLDQLKREGLITSEEYEQHKKKILEQGLQEK